MGYFIPPGCKTCSRGRRSNPTFPPSCLTPFIQKATFAILARQRKGMQIIGMSGNGCLNNRKRGDGCLPGQQIKKTGPGGGVFLIKLPTNRLKRF